MPRTQAGRQRHGRTKFRPSSCKPETPEVQDQSDGEIFYKIRFGFNRHPALYATVTDDETWAVVRYMRSMGSDGTAGRE